MQIMFIEKFIRIMRSGNYTNVLKQTGYFNKIFDSRNI